MLTVALPIFPLGVVLFPGTALPLHLFEPRYRQMLADVRAGDSRFGILPGLPNTPERELPAGRFGCVAEVTEVEVMPDGRANIIVQGRERFMLAQFVESASPYQVADVSYVDDVPGDSPVALAVAADDLASNFKRVVTAVHVLNDNPAPPPPLPESPTQIAWSVAAMIDLDVEQRYRLLAERTPSARLAQVDALLRRVLPDLELKAAMHGARG
jgi:Lon protease-like protein